MFRKTRQLGLFRWTRSNIFLSVDRPNGWTAYKVVDIEYFLATNEGPFCEPCLGKLA